MISLRYSRPTTTFLSDTQLKIKLSLEAVGRLQRSCLYGGTFVRHLQKTPLVVNAIKVSAFISLPVQISEKTILVYRSKESSDLGNKRNLNV